jgi:uncharacterized membrane protein
MATPFFSPLAHAQSYNPGVSVGQYVTFGQIGVTFKGSGAPPSFVSQLNQTRSLTVLVTAVNLSARNVTATQTYLYKNGTTQSQILAGNVASGYGNLSLWIVAGGLSAGDSLTQGYGFLGITETVAKPYAGAVRPVNVLVAKNSFYNLTAVWDQSTGFLVEISEQVSELYLGQTYSIQARVTTTNAWTTSSLPDFGFDATPQTSPFIHLGQSIMFSLNLTSINSYSGGVSLTPQLLNSSLPNPPTLSLGQNTLQVPSAGSVQGTVTFSTSASTVLGLYLFSVTGTSSSVSHIVTIAVYVIPPDYEIFSTPSNLTAAVGSSKTSTITVEALGLFSGTVNLTQSSSTPLIQTSLDHSSVTLTPTTSIVNSTLIAAVSSFTLPGDYSATVAGTSGTLQHSVTVPITATGPDFLLNTNVTTLAISPGSTGTANIGLKSLAGFAGTITLSGSLYGGLAVTLNPSAITLSSGSTSQSTVTISVPQNVVSGDYFVTITGVSGILRHQIDISVTVSQPSFSASPNPYYLTIAPGKNATSTITLNSYNGFQGKVTLAANIDAFYTQLGYVLSPANVTLTPGGTATSKITISVPTALSSPYSASFVTIYAQSGNQTSQSSIFVTIGPSSTITPPSNSPSYFVSPNPFILTIQRGSSANSTLVFISESNFVGHLSLNTTVIGGPTGTCPGPNCPTASLNPTGVALYANGTTTSTLTINALATTPGGSYYALVSSSNGTLTQTTAVFLQVTVPDFTVTFNTNSLFLPEGGASATPSVVLSSQQGYTATVTLSRTIRGPAAVCPGPNCPTAILGSSSLALPANGIVGTSLTITTTASTPPGQYSVLVNATTGGPFHTATLYITVGFKDFGFTENPDTIILAPGGSGKISVSLGSQNSFSGNVTVSTSAFGPIGVNPTAKNITLTSGGVATFLFTVTASPTAGPGIYYVNLQATNRTITHYASVTVVVAKPDFEIYTTPSRITLLVGGTSTPTVTLLSLDGLHGTVSLSSPVVSGTGCPGPTCPAASLTRSSVALAPGGWGYSNLTVSAPSTAVLGYYTIALTATNGTLTHTIDISVDVVSLTSTSITCNTPVLAGTASSCTVTVTNTATNPAAPSGLVTLTTNSRGSLPYYCTLATATPTSATCTVIYTPRIAGSHTITADYQGDGTHSVSLGATSLTASSRSTSTTITCNSSVLAGQAATCTATVTDTSGSGSIAPFGTVSFTQTGTSGSFSSSTCYLYGTGNSASCNVTFTPAASGTSNINAASAGEQVHTGSSTPSPATINSSKRTSALTVACTSPVAIGQASTCTATATDTSSSGTAITPTGTVSFSSTGSGSLSATSCTLSGGSCSVSFTGSAIGTGTVNGTYVGDIAHTGSSSTLSSINVTAPTPDFSLNSNPSSLTIIQGSSATTTITLTAQNGFSGTASLSATAPNGVTVTLNPSSIGPGQSSTITITISSTLAVGSYTVTITGVSGSNSHQTTMSITVNSQIQQTQPFLGLPTIAFALLAASTAAAGLGTFAILRRKRARASSGLVPKSP